MKKMLWIVTTALLMVMVTVYAHASTDKIATSEASWKDRQMAAIEKGSCRFAPEGVVDGQWKLHRILQSDEAIAGANDMGTLVAQYQELRLQGRCR